MIAGFDRRIIDGEYAPNEHLILATSIAKIRGVDAEKLGKLEYKATNGNLRVHTPSAEVLSCDIRGMVVAVACVSVDYVATTSKNISPLVQAKIHAVIADLDSILAVIVQNRHCR